MEAALDPQKFQESLVITSVWKVRPEEVEAVADILRRFVPQARKDRGVQAFLVHQSRDEPAEFFFYEVFEDKTAFDAHQKTPHFKALIAGDALPRLAKRERAQYALI